MAKTESEILSYLKENATTKKLSVSEITMQKIAARISAKGLSEEQESAALEDAIEFMNVQNDEIRFQRSQQKKMTEKEVREKLEKEFYEANPREDKGVLDAYKKELETIKNSLAEDRNRIAAEKNKALLYEKAYSKGVPKTEKEKLDKIIGLVAVSHDSNVDDLADKVVNTFNEIAIPAAKSPALPFSVTGASGGDQEMKDFFEKAKPKSFVKK